MDNDFVEKFIEYMVMIYPSKGLFCGLISSSSGYGKPEVDHEHRKYAKKIILPNENNYVYLYNNLKKRYVVH